MKEREIGPDALQLDPAAFQKIMGARRGMIKGALLNQHLLAGLGNLYSDEALFQAAISPGPEPCLNNVRSGFCTASRRS